MKAKAAVFMGVLKDFEVREFEVTDCPRGYGQMELIASGICGTDLHFHNGKLAINPPTVIGHEFVGKITDLDEEEAKKYGLAVGDNVIADIAVPCGECLLCKSGDDANCVNMQVTNGGSIDVAPYLYGGYAEVNYPPLSNLVTIAYCVFIGIMGDRWYKTRIDKLVEESAGIPDEEKQQHYKKGGTNIVAVIVMVLIAGTINLLLQ